MRAIFLEFDGVLHPATATSRISLVAPLKRTVQRAWLFRWAWILDELLEEHPDVQVIVHSHWRMLAAEDELQSFLGPVARRFAGVTPRGQRWESIAAVVGQKVLSDFRILDPVPNAFPPGLRELIVCNPEAGLQQYAVREQIQDWLLRGKGG